MLAIRASVRLAQNSCGSVAVYDTAGAANFTASPAAEFWQDHSAPAKLDRDVFSAGMLPFLQEARAPEIAFSSACVFAGRGFVGTAVADRPALAALELARLVSYLSCDSLRSVARCG